MKKGRKTTDLLDAGFGNTVPKSRIVSLISYESGPVNRHCRDLEKDLKVIDATKGRKVRTVIYLDSGHAVLSSTARETLSERMEEN